MNSITLSGVSATAQYTGIPGIYFGLRSISVSLPVSGTLNDISITLSGALTGTKTFKNSITTNIDFKPNEDISITSTGFGANYFASINYIEGGDASCYMQTDYSRPGIFSYGTPWRFRT